MKDQTKWDRRFIELARHISTWSKDPSTQTGAVIVDAQGRIISLGYNGMAQGVEDLSERLENRDLKYKMFLHCERNAILFAQRSLEGCILYTWPFMSCAVCAAMVVQVGIKRVVAPYSENPRWVDDFELSKMQFKEAGVDVCLMHDWVAEIPVP
jgi:dCMP deaminase